MSAEFERELEELSEILDQVREFVFTNDKNVNVTHYYYVVPNEKKFLRYFEETLRDSTENQDQKEECLKSMTTLLKRLKNLYSQLSLSNEPGSIAMIDDINEYTKSLGFTTSDDGLFLELEDTLNRLQKEILS